MTQRISHALRLAVAVLLGLSALLGCGSPAPSHNPVTCPIDSGSLALAAAGRANSATPRLDGDLRTVIAHALGAGAGLHLIRVDGAPETMWRRASLDLAGNSAAREQQVEQTLGDLTGALTRARAVTTQADDLTALAVAARAARGDSRHGSPVVILADSGLQTSPPLDFRQPGVLSAEPAEIANYLQRTGQLPDLSGVTVLFAGLGATTTPQTPLTDTQINRLTTTYTAIATAAGATCVAVLATTPDTRPRTDVPEVDQVPVPPPVTFTTSDPLILGNDVIGFAPDTAQFLDPAAATTALAPVLAHLRTHPHSTVTVTGTCSSGVLGHYPDRIALSLARARAVAGLLTDAGISPDRIITHGAGTDFPDFVPDLAPDGTLLPGPAAHNRSVRLTITT